ncbi:hypothetical protein [Mycobacterium kansasii]|uniref:hypothetical protein n=1 Tax=Mycobacterium kansasii TaxID=1768 RepID=UPI00115CFAB0|nr:hypothetical protein [Mycobacterium kansasii]
MTLHHIKYAFQLGPSLMHPQAILLELRGYIVERDDPYRPIRFPAIKPESALVACAISDPSEADGIRRYTAWIIAISAQFSLWERQMDHCCEMCDGSLSNSSARPFV